MKKRVLLVDDNMFSLESLTRFIDSEMFDVYPVGSLNEALIRISQSKYDVLITDYKLPIGTGIDLIKSAKRTYDKILTVLFTGFPTKRLEQESKELEVDLFLTKPIVVHELNFWMKMKLKNQTE